MQLIECLVKNDVTELITLESELTVSKAMNGVQLNKLSGLIEKKNVIKAVAYLTIRLSENFNVGKKFTPSQASVMALDLFEVFGYETLEDVMLMFKYARQGRIGDGRDFKLDSQTVFHKWVPKYLELKAIEREKKHEENKGVKNGMATFKWTKEAVEKIKTSKKVQTYREGTGTRYRKTLSTPPEYKQPIQKRSVYLDLLREASKKASVRELKMGISNLEKEGREPDAIEVMKLELDSRLLSNK